MDWPTAVELGIGILSLADLAWKYGGELYKKKTAAAAATRVSLKKLTLD